MTNQPAANEPADLEPTERDTATDIATGNETATVGEPKAAGVPAADPPDEDEEAPRYEADYLGGELPPDDTEDTVDDAANEPAPAFAEYDAEPPYAEKTAEP